MNLWGRGKKLKVITACVKTYQRRKHNTLENRLAKKILELFLKMTLEDRLQLVTELEIKQRTAKSDVRRKYNRHDCLIDVDYIVKDCRHKGYSTNLSANGIFVESSTGILPNFSPGDQTMLTFDHPNKKQHLKITGKIARIDNKGVGIMFNQPILN